LLVYKTEGKPWDWIFKKFPGRTPAAVRTRWTMVQRKVKMSSLLHVDKQQLKLCVATTKVGL
jgi:hypothetical protein